MGVRIFNWFVKVTGLPLQWFCFRTKHHIVNEKNDPRFMKGPVIVISNHRSVWDYAVYLFTFFTRTIRVQAAEVLFKQAVLRTFLKWMGAIYVNRSLADFGFVEESLKRLKEGWLVLIFPESRLPRPGEERPLPFKESAALIALRSGAPVVPVATNGSYFNLKKRAHVMVGEPFYAADFVKEGLSDRENLKLVSARFKEIIREMQEKVDAMVL